MLIDLMRPRAGGWQMLAEVRANPEWRQVPVGLYGIADGRGRVAMPAGLDFLFETADANELLDRLETGNGGALERTNPVLVVGDDEVWRSRIVSLLATRQYKALEIASVREAVDHVRSHRVAGLIVDMLLPRPGVVALLSEIATEESVSRAPAIIIGPSTLSPMQQRDLYLGIAGWIGYNSLPTEVLGDRVRNALDLVCPDLLPAGAR
jgi:CheY-like chemotaxis protein